MDNVPSFSPKNHIRSNRQSSLQRSVSSASQVPVSLPSASFSPHIASNKYIEQFRSLIEHQRQVHNEEIQLWHLERAELDAKIARLETIVRQYKARYGSIVLSPLELSSQTRGAFGKFSANDKPRSMSASTGDEFWRGAGGKIDAHPTRTFSEPSDTSNTVADRRMPSIPENDNVRKYSLSSNRSESIPKPATKLSMDKNLDGITFKSTILSPSVSNYLMTPQSPSPLRSPSPTHPSPGPISLSATDLLSAKDFYIKDAGHTPLARYSRSSDDTANISLSNSPTPTYPEQEPPLNETRPSIAPTRQPAERSDSYFPLTTTTNPKIDPDPDHDQDIDGDPSLKAPLSLQNNSSDTSFLSELDAKLLQAARKAFEPSPSLPDIIEADTEELVQSKENAKPKDNVSGLEEGEPEAEPKLRIKRSMNFGSQLGASRCGKDII